MSTRRGNDPETITLLLQKLCLKITGLSDEAVRPLLQHSLRIITSNYESTVDHDEFQVAEKIKRRLVRKGKEKDAVVFLELHRKLQAQGVIKNRWAVLYLLMSLSDSSVKTSRDRQVGLSSTLFAGNLAGHATSTPFHPAARGHAGNGDITSLHSNTTLQSGHTSGSSGISSIHGEIHSNDPTPIPHSYMPLPSHTGMDSYRDSTSVGLRLASTLSSDRGSSTAVVPHRGRTSKKTTITVHKNDQSSEELPEAAIIRDLVYAFQGIEGRWIRFDPTKEGYRINHQAGIPKAIRQLVSKLAECGWLFNKTKTYVENKSADKTFGLVGKSFCAALHEELTEYYRLIAVLEGQILSEGDRNDGQGLSLRQLVLWTFDPLQRLKCLATIVDVCRGKKGGALASALYSYMQHGDPFVQSLIQHILNMVAQPIYIGLVSWMYDGELEDMHDEFFVASDPTVKNDRLWHDKYSLRKSMIPNFITREQANRILLTGKSINYLRQVCQDRTPTKGRQVITHMDSSQADVMFRQDTTSEFQHMVDRVYKETSHHLLDVLNSKYKFLEHLKAMRRYLLLGQGDFIRHLMDLLLDDLAKPASNLYLHNLTGILETAIRATNAQFDDSDILKRLDVRLLEVSPGDKGWDVFSLEYHVDGPIRTVFTPQCMMSLLRIFNFLWRAKRMEYILAIVWKNQMSNSRGLRGIPELSGILHQCHVLASEMVHFIQQVQYYINFEVLECSWDELLTKVKEAEDFDNVIAAHQVFLNTVISRCLLDEQSRDILTQLRTIFDLIIDFQTAQSEFYEEANDELQARQHYDKLQQMRSQKGDWALTAEYEEEEHIRRVEFLKNIIPSKRARFKVLSQSYQDMVKQFLVMLTYHKDVSLRFLSFRLDFNEHYKAKEPKLRSPSVHRLSRSAIS